MNLNLTFRISIQQIYYQLKFTEKYYSERNIFLAYTDKNEKYNR